MYVFTIVAGTAGVFACRCRAWRGGDRAVEVRWVVAHFRNKLLYAYWVICDCA